ncbi:hypothetical protein, partial [Actinoplanes italicus]|uniref:hypothetical protein n=1 Tax=Actinoplanes italicus TaxID=113567 RepID=UPI0019415AF8
MWLRPVPVRSGSRGPADRSALSLAPRGDILRCGAVDSIGVGRRLSHVLDPHLSPAFGLRHSLGLRFDHGFTHALGPRLRHTLRLPFTHALDP